MIEKNKKLAFEETLKLAIKSHKENKLDIAKDLYTKVLEINPNHIASNNNLGLLFSNLSKLEEAKKCFEKIIELEPNNTDAHYNLGLIFSNLNELQKAKKCFEKTIFINPNHINAYNKLGLIFSTFGEDRKAIITLTNALNINPNNENVLASLSTLFQEIVLSNLNKTDILSLKKIFIHLIKKNNLNAKHRITNIKSLLFSQNEMDRLLQFNMSKSLLTDENIQILLKEELLHLMLQRFVINNIFLEKLFTKLRTEILSILNSTNKKNLKEHSNFINSLAEQCWLNEYIYALSEKEITDINKLKQKIENDNDINELEISILACYVPLNKSKNILDKLINYKSTSIFFNNLINVQITEPLRELTLAKSIKTFDKINDSVSIKVKEQYEEHPYPRWRSFLKHIPYNFNIYQNYEIKPNKVKFSKKFNNPNLLIAGCGTGNHIINSNRYENVNILAVDISLSSLSYAKRKIQELGLKNVEFLNADILQLKNLNKKFDIIESVGTLHHMKDPAKGLKVLLDILEPHGYLKLGLYSETARQGVVKAREFIKKENLCPSIEDIRICRKELINQKEDSSIQFLTLINDFYSASGVRDLLFNVQEHRFTIPKISKLLKDLNLEFIGFTFTNPIVKQKFSRTFPDDKKNISLDNWHQFELNNPYTFFGMYTFWVRKR